MAYKGSAKFKGRRRHTCVGCGALYSYDVERTGTSQASTQEAAIAGARTNGLAQIQNAVTAHPCPSCGTYQGDMIANMASSRSCAACVPGLAMAVIGILGAAGIMPFELSSVVVLAGMALSILGLVIVARA